MSFVRQVGYVINVGPVFVTPLGVNNQQLILQCQVERIDGELVWTTKTKEPAYVPVLNNDATTPFPYTFQEVGIEGYENNQYVTLGTDMYKRPDFMNHANYDKSYQNIDSDWLNVSFRAPNLIRNRQESAYYSGSDGTPPATQTTVQTGNSGTGTGVKVGGGTGGGGGTTTVYKTATATQAEVGKIPDWAMFAGLGLLTLIVLSARNNQ